MAAVHCPVCKQPTLASKRVRQQVRARDETLLEYHDELSSCSACGEEFYTPDQSLASSRARAATLRAHEGLLSPQEIKHIRESYALSQADLEKALGLGPKTVVRWERGSVCQSRAADNLLVMARDFPEVFAAIAQRNGVDVVLTTTAGAVQPKPNVTTVKWWKVSHVSATVPLSSSAPQRTKYGRFRRLQSGLTRSKTYQAA